ncbi:MAG: hypothetical protein EOR68_13685 [Mesorhizobium sp.]|uniref:hypothetical protein n=1 Tax=Mesorhizobium sp. TaxID=1871066 RepID=UPI000FE9CE19|nr:hypothetical protein [Mesorhizobium sp.]RWL99152.1 MAG: hypothetical protein EOR68_13685 [Mesorhizobium sp.]TIP49160.1 MAG: hypothetical protein E5X77_12285 [Mesorhizobium sp.]
MTPGEVIIEGLMSATMIGAAFALLRYDLVSPRNAPGYRDIRDALKHGKPLPSQWKSVDESNRAGYGILALRFLSFGILVFAGARLAEFIDQF